jgi:N-formylglutamate amidohydrolase
LQAGEELPFEFSEPAKPSPLVISFPHVGLEWPHALGPRPQVNFARNADFAVHALYPHALQLGATLVRARFSRLVVDLNRAADDVSPDLVPDHPAPRPRPTLGARSVDRSGRAIRNRGVVWQTAIGNIPLFSRLPYAHLQERIRRYYEPYHRALSLLLEQRRERFGFAILLDAHSMPGAVGPDMVLGTRSGETCGSTVRDLALDALRAEQGPALEISLDQPYGGGELIHRFGRPQAHVHAMQLEVSRALYMDELRLELWPPLTHDVSQAARVELPNPQTAARPELAGLLMRLEGLVEALSTAEGV